MEGTLLYVVCLFGVYRPTREFFTHMEIAGEGLQILTLARPSWPLCSESSLTCRTHCDTGHLRGPMTLTPVAERLAVELSLPVLTT